MMQKRPKNYPPPAGVRGRQPPGGTIMKKRLVPHSSKMVRAIRGVKMGTVTMRSEGENDRSPWHVSIRVNISITPRGDGGGRFAYEKIGISQLCARTPVFLHTFGDPPRTFKNRYKSTLAVFPLNWGHQNGTNNANYGPCRLHMDPVHKF